MEYKQKVTIKSSEIKLDPPNPRYPELVLYQKYGTHSTIYITKDQIHEFIKLLEQFYEETI